LAAALAIACVTSEAAYHPSTGDLCYDGVYYADSYMLWNPVGPWLIEDPGYEHDLVLNDQFFNDCTSATNLPNAYDDCFWAGVSEQPGEMVFSFGSFHSRNIAANTWNAGLWNFTGGATVTQTPFTLRGQEVAHDTCPFDWSICMLSRRGRNLLSGYMNWYGIPSCMAY
jgi:hypothetical protein